ncbi:hypothetical protein GCM10027168_11810 [Streptomyces capparidis]
MTNVPDPVCVQCGERRCGRHYEFQVGVPRSMTNMGNDPYKDTITTYKILGTESGFLCDRCARRHVLIRGPLPLLACLVIEAVLFAGLPFHSVRVPQPMLPVLFLALVGLVWFAGGATRRALKLVGVGWRGALEIVWSLIAWVILVTTHVGGPFTVGIIVDDLDEPGQHSVLDASSDDQLFTFDVVIFGVTAGLHLLLLLVSWFGRRDSLERLVWKHRKSALRRNRPGLCGFSSVQYNALIPSRN